MGSENIFKTVSNYNRDNWSAVGNRYEQIQDALTIIAPSVPELIFNRKQEGLGTNVLDLFGPGGKTGKAFMRQADS